MIKLNKRLKTIGDLVESHSFVLDVGTDHGLLVIYLLQKGIKAVGSDNKEGPVENAKKNLKRNKIDGEIRIGDGLDALQDEDTVVISGMGGLNIINILRNNLAKAKKINTFIISPNNYVEAVRRYLVKIGFYIDNEVLVKDKYIYNVIVFKKGHKFYNKRDYYFGPVLRRNQDKLFKEYFTNDKKSKLIIYNLLDKKQYSRKLLLKRTVKMIESELK